MDMNYKGDEQFIQNSQLWNIYRYVIGEIYPAIRNMDSFKSCCRKFFQELQREPCSTIFHFLVACFGVLPFFGFIMFITGTFVFTVLCGSFAFFFMFFSGLMVFCTLGLFILLFCAWLSGILTGVCYVWMEWPYIWTGVCTIREKSYDMLAELGFFVKRTQADVADRVNTSNNNDNRESDCVKHGKPPHWNNNVMSDDSDNQNRSPGEDDIWDDKDCTFSNL